MEMFHVGQSLGQISELCRAGIDIQLRHEKRTELMARELGVVLGEVIELRKIVARLDAERKRSQRPRIPRLEKFIVRMLTYGIPLAVLAITGSWKMALQAFKMLAL